MYLFASYNLLHKTHQYFSDSIQVEFKLHNSWKIPNKSKCNWENQSLTQQRKKEFREQRIVIKEFHTNRWRLTEKNQWSSVEGNIYYEKWKTVIVNCISKPHTLMQKKVWRELALSFFFYTKPAKIVNSYKPLIIFAKVSSSKSTTDTLKNVIHV